MPTSATPFSSCSRATWAPILAVIYASIAGLSVPFQPVHLLFINLLTDSLPAIALGMEPARPGLMDQPSPRPQCFHDG